jgi:hypothetical protein
MPPGPAESGPGPQQIELSRLDGFVSQPERDNGAIHAEAHVDVNRRTPRPEPPAPFLGIGSCPLTRQP